MPTAETVGATAGSAHQSSSMTSPAGLRHRNPIGVGISLQSPTSRGQRMHRRQFIASVGGLAKPAAIHVKVRFRRPIVEITISGDARLLIPFYHGFKTKQHRDWMTNRATKPFRDKFERVAVAARMWRFKIRDSWAPQFLEFCSEWRQCEIRLAAMRDRCQEWPS